MKIRKLNEASEGFQKEFYNGYVILKNRAGDGWDIYSYEGTPEKVTRAVKEEEGLATLKDAKATIDSWADKVDEGIDGWDNRTGVIKRIDKYLSSNPEAVPPKGYIKKRTRAYDDAVSRYGDYVTTPFGNISTDDLMQYARDNKLLDESYDTVTRYQVEYYISNNDEEKLVDYIYADSKDDVRKQLVAKTKAEGIDYIMITSMIPEEVPASYKDNDLKESKLTLNEALFTEDYSDEVVTLSRYLDVEVPDICSGVLDLIEHLPSHKIVYITKICRDFYAKMESIITNYTMTGDNFDESLQEDVTDVVTDTLSGPTEGPESGLSALLNEAVQDEFKTIQMYNDIAVSARAEGFEDIATVVDEINTEENKHVGQLQELLKTVSPNAKAIDTGEIEGKQQVDEVTEIVEEDINNSNSSPNNNIEEDDKVMKESWEEVYQSFKTIEKELNGDGEAITATIDQLYRDNKGNPDYEKAYDKWASGE